ncbi:YesL family protein [Streptococcus fryi]
MPNKAKQLISDIFSLDSGFMKFCEWLFDLTILNLLFLISCLPIVTIGVAKLSLFTCLNQMERQEKLVPWTAYPQTFKDNLKEGIALGLVENMLIGFCLLNLVLLNQETGVFISVIQVLSIGVLILTVIIFLYAYPLASRYEMPLKDVLIKSLLMSGLYFPKTLLLVGGLVGLVLMLMSSTLVLLAGLSLLAIIGISLLALIQHRVISKALDENHTTYQS